MKIPFRGLLKNILHLGSGELVSRLSNIATVVLLGRRFGVAILGVYALGQTVTQYAQPLIDFGLRHVGARLLAMYPQAARDVVERVQRRRLGMAVLVLPLILVYSLCANLPVEMKLFLFAFSAVGVLYAISLDWAAWGRGQLQIVGLAKSAVPLSILAFLAIGRPPADRVLWYAVAGNAFGFLLQGAVSWAWWNRQPARLVQAATPTEVHESLAWRRTSIMGIAWLCNLAFNNIDMLMLGLMSNPEQVGLYGAAYRVLNQVLATYYLLTQVLYPQFARHDIKHRARMLRARILLPLLGTGILIAAAVSLSRRIVLTTVFGHQFLAAGPLLILLAWSIPLDFMTSYLSNAFIAWGMEKKILLCTGIGAASNVVLNLALIPTQGARGAAVNTLLSYAIFLIALCLVGRTAKELGPRTRPETDAVIAAHA
ncbi:MAG: oligosaccharide flippase family protein [Acidobacteriia bacterium]|nr:oligosaccharide flippase family protein [Terriglobia bacterium]